MNSASIIPKSIFAGVFIGIASLMYSITNSILGTLMFSFGLICVGKFNCILYTGAIGSVVEATYKNNKLHDILSRFLVMVYVFLFNIIGSYIVAIVVSSTSMSDRVRESCNNIVFNKFNNYPSSILFTSIMCGLMMYIASRFLKNISDISNLVGLILSISIFILCGFDHSIANSFYLFTSSYISNVYNIIMLLLMMIGNTIGSAIPALVNKYFRVW